MARFTVTFIVACRSALSASGRTVGLVAGLAIAVPLTSAAALAQSPTSPAAEIIVVVGAAGTSEYRTQFQRDAGKWAQLARNRELDLLTIDEDEKAEQGNHREQLQAAIAEAARAQSEAPLWIVLIGHGTSERGVHKFNLVGPDISSKELAQWLKELGERSVVLINCSSASAPFLPELSGPNRIVVTATRSGSENNYSRFGTQLADCVLDPATDIDHDEEVSLLEAFLAAAAKTEKFYREQNRLATEHALIDDNGDKLGTGAEFFRGTRAVKAAQAGKQPDGAVAAKLILFSAPDVPKLSESAQARRAEIETQIAELRASKPAPPTDDYWDKLEQLLLQLAELYAQAERE